MVGRQRGRIWEGPETLAGCCWIQGFSSGGRSTGQVYSGQLQVQLQAVLLKSEAAAHHSQGCAAGDRRDQCFRGNILLWKTPELLLFHMGLHRRANMLHVWCHAGKLSHKKYSDTQSQKSNSPQCTWHTENTIPYCLLFLMFLFIPQTCVVL